MPSTRLPRSGSKPVEFAEFTWKEWRALDNKYQYYADIWRKNLDYLRGQHWKVSADHDQADLPKWRRFPVINYVLSFYQQYMTSWMDSKIRFTSLPASPDPKDIDGAELGEILLRYTWDKLDMEEKRIDLGSWICATGNAALRIYWNTDTGNQAPLVLGEGQQGQGPMVDLGEIGIEVISPQFVRWPRSPRDGVMLGLLLSFEEAEAFFGAEAAERLPYSDDHTGLSADLTTIEGPVVSVDEEKRTLVIQHYLPKSATNPGGLWWTAAHNGTEILNGPYPLPSGFVPIIPFRWVPIPGDRTMGLTPITTLTTSNKMYEEALGKALEWVKKVQPKVLLPAGGGLRKGDVNEEAFQELIVNPGGEPQVLEPPDFPGSYKQLMEDAREDLMFNSGLTLLKSTRQKSGKAAGTTQAFRQQSDEESQGDMARLAIVNSRAAWQQIGKVVLAYAGAFYTEQRVIAIQGPDRSYQWREFSGSDLQNIEATIRVDETSLYPWDRQGMQDAVIGLMNTQAGAILLSGPDGQPDRDRIMAAFQATGLDTDLETLDPDIVESRNEISMTRNLPPNSQPPAPKPWQNSQVHVSEKERIMKSARFTSWPPQAQQALLQNVEAHKKILSDAAASEQRAMLEQESQLREIREELELSADVRRMIAEQVIEGIIEPLRNEIARLGIRAETIVQGEILDAKRSELTNGPTE